MNILAVETSGYEGSIGLASGSDFDVRFLPTEGRRHAQTLVQEIHDLLHHHDLRPTAIDVVAVSIGPGSFTGLRVGVVFAKTFAWANQCSLVAVDTHRAIAQQTDRSRETWVITDAQRNEVFLSRYQCDGEAIVPVMMESISIRSVAELAESIRSEDVQISGPGLKKFAAQLDGARCQAPAELWNPAADSVAKIGASLVAEQELADIMNLEPLYIRRSYAEEKAAQQSSA